MDCYKTLRKPLPSCELLQILTAFTDHYKTPSNCYVLYSIADISKQIDKGQEKQSQGVDLTSIPDVNNYIKFKILKYGYYKLINNNLQEQYKEDFADFTEATFKAYSIIPIRNLRNLLCYYSIQVKKDKQVTIAQSLYNTLYKENQTKQTKE